MRLGKIYSIKEKNTKKHTFVHSLYIVVNNKLPINQPSFLQPIFPLPLLIPLYVVHLKMRRIPHPQSPVHLDVCPCDAPPCDVRDDEGHGGGDVGWLAGHGEGLGGFHHLPRRGPTVEKKNHSNNDCDDESRLKTTINIYK